MNEGAFSLRARRAARYGSVWSTGRLHLILDAPRDPHRAGQPAKTVAVNEDSLILDICVLRVYELTRNSADLQR